jgi:predicted TIM-barrel fold metal-dependent hydrolase
MWAPFVPATEVIDDLRAGFPAELLSYFEVFTKTTISAEQFSDYVESRRWTDDQILESLDTAGITRSLITGFDEKSTCGVTFVNNVPVAAVAARRPDRFIPFAGADIMAGSSSSAGWLIMGFAGSVVRCGSAAQHLARIEDYPVDHQECCCRDRFAQGDGEQVL